MIRKKNKIEAQNAWNKNPKQVAYTYLYFVFFRGF